ncbi:MAG: hypothetical protein AAF602_22160 [Myxococcota bacterium]
MSDSAQLKRLNPFPGLAITANDLADEQAYHRHALKRHALYLNGFGIVQGLQVELEQKRKKYTAVVKAGYGIARTGQGIHLDQDVVIPLEIPQQDGEYILWLFHQETPDDSSLRPVFDTDDQRESRIVEGVTPRLLPANEEPVDGVALTRLTVRLGRLVQVQLPVPRAGRQIRAAESYLKPRVVEFIRLNRRIITNLFRTSTLQEQSIGLVAFTGALITAEFMLIEEGTADRVLYRSAGTLISYAHDFYHPLPPTTDRVSQFTEFLRRVNAEIPGPDQADDTWLRWFLQFERLLQPLQRINEELERTVEGMRE